MTSFGACAGELGRRPLPYLWVPEWHPGGHGLHVHFGVGQYVQRGKIESAWGRGFVHIKLLSDLSATAGSLAEARHVAGYLSKYVSKSFDGAKVPGLHRYEVAQGYAPASERLYGRTADVVLSLASERLGSEPEIVWRSQDEPDWKAPPSVWASWAA